MTAFDLAVGVAASLLLSSAIALCIAEACVRSHIERLDAEEE